MDSYTHLLTGYIGSASFLKRVALLVTTLKAKNPNLTYGTLSFNSNFLCDQIFFMIYTYYTFSILVCDPVMGDNGKMYVPEALKEIYKEEIIPLADIVTPNQFELEYV